MYKQLIAILFLFAFALQTFNRAIILLDYKTFTEYYAALCENKTKPSLQCNGKCQMMKKMKEEEKKEQQNPDRKGEKKAEIVLSSKSFYPSITLPTFVLVNAYTSLNDKSEIKMPRTLLRPPIC